MRVGGQRHLGLGGPVGVFGQLRRLHVNEGAQAFVLAEVAARGFRAGRLILDPLDRLNADKGRLTSVVPKPSGLESGADGPGFAAMLVDNHVRLHILALEARLDEINLRLNGRQIVLRTTLQQEARANGRDVRNL